MAYFSYYGVFAAPLLITGFYGVYKLINNSRKSNISVIALVVLIVGLILYNIGAVIDGLFLPLVGHEAAEASGNAKDAWGVLVTYTHEFAVNFGGLAFAHLLLGTGLLGVALKKVEGFKIFGILGMLLGAVALMGVI